MANSNIDQVRRVLVNRVSEQAVFPSELILTSVKAITVVPARDPINGNHIEVPTDLKLTVPGSPTFQIVAIPSISQKSLFVLEEFVGPCSDALLSVNMYNFTGSDIEIKAGDQIAQLDILTPRTIELVDVTPRHGLRRRFEAYPHLNETEQSTEDVMPSIKCTNFNQLN